VNLVENAIKYSPSGTPTEFRRGLRAMVKLRLSVEDEGPGVPVAGPERIFEPFFRNQMARKSNVPGHGLGLGDLPVHLLAHGGRSRSMTGREWRLFQRVPPRARTSRHPVKWLRNMRSFRNRPFCIASGLRQSVFFHQVALQPRALLARALAARARHPTHSH